MDPPDWSWANSVDPDTPGKKLVGKDSGHGDLGSLGHRVIEQGRRAGVGDLGSIVTNQIASVISIVPQPN